MVRKRKKHAPMNRSQMMQAVHSEDTFVSVAFGAIL